MEWIVTAVILYLVIAFFIKKGKSNNNTISHSSSPSRAAVETSKTPPKLKRQPQYKSASDQTFEVEISLTGTLNDDSGRSIPAGHDDLAGEWIPLGKETLIKGKTIPGGGFYLRDSKGDKGALDDPSLVDATLNVSAGVTYQYEDPDISYYPRYRDLNARAKGAYLDWLASDRKDPKAPITYPFIYFYGIERRFLLDHLQGSKVGIDELRALFKEVNRLRNVYDGNRSFRGYANRLMDLMILYKPELFPSIGQPFISGPNSLSLRYQIGLSALNDRPIGPALAFGWVRYHPEYSGGTVMRRCEKVFKKLFILRYKQQYGRGFRVQPNKRNLDIRYTAASSLFSYYGRTNLELPKVAVPDPFELVGPLRKLEKVADPVLEELKPLSRYLGKEGHRPDDIEASLLLPKALIAEDMPPVLWKLKKILTNHLDSKERLFPVVSLWKELGKPAPEKLNKSELDLLSRIMDNLDIGFAPDPRYHQVKPDPKGNISLYRLDDEAREGLGERLSDYAFVVRLGAMVAIQNERDTQEFEAVGDMMIDSNMHLSDPEKRSLHSYLHWCMDTKISMAGVKKSVNSMDQNQIDVLSRTLVAIALADGHASSDEIKQLERIYAAMGLDQALVTRDIHEASGYSAMARSSLTPGTEPKHEAFDSSTPPKVLTPDTRVTKPFSLDEAVLAMHEGETRDAQKILGGIFTSEDEENDLTIILNETAVGPEEDGEQIVDSDDDGELEGNTLFDGLNETHQSFMTLLLEAPEWSRADVDTMATGLGLMTDGAIEVVNDWAFDQVGAPLIEDEGAEVVIDQDTLKELRELKETTA